MSSVLEYKGYHTKIEFDSEEFILRGKIEGINDFIDFESDNLNGIETEFHEAVDDYLEFCKEVGKEPEKEYKGTFNVRISPKLHKELSIMAMKNNTSLNATVEQALVRYVSNEHSSTIKLEKSIKIFTELLQPTSTYKYNIQTVKPTEQNITSWNPNINLIYQS